MKPLRVTMFLSTPLARSVKVRPYPIMFDSIIIELMAQRENKFDYDHNNYDPYAPENNDKGVPLAVGGTHQKFYLASAIEIVKEKPSATQPYFLSFVKRTDWIEDEEFEKYANWKRNKLLLVSGIYRNAREILPGTNAPIVNFYCVGDQAAIEDILSDLSAIGVKTGIGMGKILKLTVSEIEQDYSLFDKNGNPARPIPVEEHPGGRGWLKDYCTYKAPYWLEGNKKMCWIPPIYRWYPT